MAWRNALSGLDVLFRPVSPASTCLPTTATNVANEAALMAARSQIEGPLRAWAFGGRAPAS